MCKAKNSYDSSSFHFALGFCTVQSAAFLLALSYSLREQKKKRKKEDNLRFISMLWPKRAAFTPACSEVGKRPTRVSFFLWFLVPSSIGTKTSSLLIVLSLGLSMKVLLFLHSCSSRTVGKKKLCGQGHVAIQTRQAKKGAASVYRGFKSIRKLTHFLHCLHMSQSGDHSRGVRIGKPGQRPRKKKDISGGNRGLRTISHFLVQTSISKNHRCFSVILVSSQKL